MLQVLLERCPERAEQVMDHALALWAEDTVIRLMQQARELDEPCTVSFMDRHFTLYANIDQDLLWAQYDKNGAKALLKKGFYDRVLPQLAPGGVQ